VIRQSLIVISTAAALGAGGLAGAGAPATAVQAGRTPHHGQVVQVGKAAHSSQTLQARARRHVSYQQWASRAQLRRGSSAGAAVTRDGVRIRRAVGRMTYRDPESGTRTRYELARWTSPWVAPGFALTEAVPSWNAVTPRGTWVRVQMRVRTPSGRRSSWDTLGSWASHERRFHRRTSGSQGDDLASVAVDTLRSRGVARLTGWQVRAVLLRRAGTSATPRLRGIGAMVSRLPDTDPPTTRTTMRGRTVDLAVPRRSQMTHRGHFPQFGNGGEAWCSPTSTTMVLGFWDAWPRPAWYRWVGAGHRDPEVDFTARAVYDHGFNGAGNWAFNTAYAHRYGMRSFVTRLRSLREAERFIRAGIPLVASVQFGPGELTGAPIRATDGHLMVIRGFTGRGHVIANDPAARRNRGVRRVYDRAQFADAWVGGSGGLVYVIRPAGRALPARTAEANW
jgi:hypothetical protein